MRWSGKGAVSPPPPPLRTVREGCPSYGSSGPLPSVLPEALSRRGRCLASGSVCGPMAGPHPTCPLGLPNPPGSCRGVRPAHVSRLSARATRPDPPGYAFPLPLGRWRSLLGPSCSRCGLGRPSEDRPAYWHAGQTATGLPRSASEEGRRGRAPSLLRGLGVREPAQDRSRSRGPTSPRLPSG